MKDKVVNLAKKIIKSIKSWSTSHTKMKLLVAYLTANLIYILVGSYIFSTENISTQFHYKEFALGLKKLLEYNVIVFLIIVFEKQYKKNWTHLGIFFMAIFRDYFDFF